MSYVFHFREILMPKATLSSMAKQFTNLFHYLSIPFCASALLLAYPILASDTPIIGIQTRVIPSRYVCSPINNVLIFKTLSEEFLVVILQPAPGVVFTTKELDGWLHGYTCETFITKPEYAPDHDACVWVGHYDLPHAVARTKNVPVPKCETFLLKSQSAKWPILDERN